MVITRLSSQGTKARRALRWSRFTISNSSPAAGTGRKVVSWLSVKPFGDSPLAGVERPTHAFSKPTFPHHRFRPLHGDSVFAGGSGRRRRPIPIQSSKRLDLQI